MLRVAVTGSKGFIGTSLVKKLKVLEYEVIEIDFELGYDITDWSSLSSIECFDVLIHLAAKTFVPDSFINPASFYNTNVIGTLNALELCRKYNARMIFTSSYVYGSPEYLPIDENHPIKAFNPYAQSKILGEELCKAYSRDFNISSIIFRPFNIYGKGQSDSFLIPSIIKQAFTGTISLKDPRPRRDFIYIDDVIDAYAKAITFHFDTFEIFNLGSGVSASIKELTQIVSKGINQNTSVDFSGEQRKNEVLETIANINKAKRILNWSPQYHLQKGIDKIIDN